MSLREQFLEAKKTPVSYRNNKDLENLNDWFQAYSDAFDGIVENCIERLKTRGYDDYYNDIILQLKKTTSSVNLALSQEKIDTIADMPGFQALQAKCAAPACDMQFYISIYKANSLIICELDVDPEEPYRGSTVRIHGTNFLAEHFEPLIAESIAKANAPAPTSPQNPAIDKPVVIGSAVRNALRGTKKG